MTLDDLVVCDLDGNVLEGERGPTTEKMLHLACLKAYDDIHAVIHCHAKFCTMFAITHQPIPCVIEEVEVFVGGDVPVANYKFTGSQDLADEVSKWVGDRAAVLMANHGLLTVGKSPKDALKIAQPGRAHRRDGLGRPPARRARAAPRLDPREDGARSTRCSAACSAVTRVRRLTSRSVDARQRLAAEREAVGDREHHRVDAVVGGDEVVERLDRDGVVVGRRRPGSPGRPRARCRRAITPFGRIRGSSAS